MYLFPDIKCKPVLVVLSFSPLFHFSFSSSLFLGPPSSCYSQVSQALSHSHFCPHCCIPLLYFSIQIKCLFLLAKIYWAVPGSVTAHTFLPSLCTVVNAHSMIILFPEVSDLLQHPPTLAGLCALQQLCCFSAWLKNKAHNLRDLREEQHSYCSQEADLYLSPLNGSAILTTGRVQPVTLCNCIHVMSKLRLRTNAPNLHLHTTYQKMGGQGWEITEGITLLFLWYNHSQAAPHTVYCTLKPYTDITGTLSCRFNCL